jgi:hypothetical protein
LRLEEVMREMPQAELCTEHYWADGMYCRKLYWSTGMLVVGKVHKKEHLFIVSKGYVQVIMDDGVKDL